jgi:hypothetical protein
MGRHRTITLTDSEGAAVLGGIKEGRGDGVFEVLDTSEVILIWNAKSNLMFLLS